MKNKENPNSPKEWQNEVFLTKVRDRLNLIRNRDSKRFDEALSIVAETDEFIAHGAQLEVFIVRNENAAKIFSEALGYTTAEILYEKNPYEKFVHHCEDNK